MTPMPGDFTICSCGHYANSHVRGTGRCRQHDPFGDPCDCRGFEADASDDEPERAREED